MARALSAVALKNLKPGASRREIPDGGAPGLYVVVQTTGAMSWVLRCRVDGKPVKVTLGRVNLEQGAKALPELGGYLTLAEARIVAAQQRHALNQGLDPRQQKAAALEAAAAAVEAMRGETVSVVVGDFLKKHSRAKARRSADEVKRLFEKHVLPAWGRRQIGDITRKDVVARLGEIAQDTPVQANRVLANVRKMFNWAIGQDIIQANPAHKVAAPGKETSRDRVLSPTEIKAFWEAAGSLGYPFAPALRLLLLTAQRREEVGGMRHGELDVDRGVWVVPRERAKNGIANLVPLTSAAAGILKGLPRRTGKAGYVFTTTGKTSVSGWTKAKTRLDKAMKENLVKAGVLAEDEQVEHWVLHDLRRSAATLMAKRKVAPHVIEAVINHKTGKVSGVAAVYNVYEYEEEKRAALEVLSAEVERLVGGAL